MERQILRQFVPLNELTEENLLDLAGKTAIEVLPKGKSLFRKGDRDNTTYYLLSGELLLIGEQQNQWKQITGGTSPTRYPLDHHSPRQHTAIANTEVRYFRIDNDLLDILLTWDQNAGYMVSEIDVEEERAGDANGDWMTMMLRTELFHRIPPSNIQQVFMRMEPMPVRAGDTIIEQGEDGDYYYFIKQGKVLVTHVTKAGKEIRLAELEKGNGFGEEALVSNNKRNANVSMLTDGILMRMSKEDFESLLKAPILHTVDFPQTLEMMQKGAEVLDVRLESEYKHVHLPGSTNIPLYLLRIKARELDKSKQYIVYCDTGRRSSSAAYILNERGYNAFYLKGGLRGLNKTQLSCLRSSA